MSIEAAEYFNQKIREFKIVPPLSVNWIDLRNTIKILLNFQSNSYFESIYPCKAMLSYRIWYRDEASKEDQSITSSIDITQSIIVFSKPDSGKFDAPYHLNLPHECLLVKSMPKYLIVAFLYPECGKAVMFVPGIHLLSKVELAEHSLKMYTFNWNWFYQDETNIKCKKQNMYIDVTLSTGTSAMPLGICNVLLPRFDYGIRHISQTFPDPVYYFWEQHPINPEMGVIIDSAKRKKSDALHASDNSLDKITVSSWNALIGIPIKSESNKITVSDSILVNKLIDNAKKNLSSQNNDKFSSGKLFYWMSLAPNLFTLNDLVQIELCLIECEYPMDIFMTMLQVIGEMMW